MVDPKVPNVFCLILIMLASAYQGHMAHDIHSPPSYDPRLSQFVWFSTFADSSRLEDEDSINVQPIKLPSAVEFHVNHKKDQKDVQKVQRMAMRL